MTLLSSLHIFQSQSICFVLFTNNKPSPTISFTAWGLSISVIILAEVMGAPFFPSNNTPRAQFASDVSAEPFLVFKN